MNLPARAITAVVSFLFGFVFFPFFILGALIAFSVISDFFDTSYREENSRPPVTPYPPPFRAEDMRRRCDSPAETAFLDIMIAEFGLGEGPGCLKGETMRLRSQVGMGHYKGPTFSRAYQYYADFLLDDRLVVEIDGATYHSSPEALKRDAARDADMRRWGYTVLRIPAKVVFNNTAEVVQRIRDARRATGVIDKTEAVEVEPDVMQASSATATDISNTLPAQDEERVLEKNIEALIGPLEEVFLFACAKVDHRRAEAIRHLGVDLSPSECTDLFQRVAQLYLDDNVTDARRESRKEDLDALRDRRWSQSTQAQIPQLVEARIAKHLEAMELSYFKVFEDQSEAPNLPEVKAALTSAVLAILLEGADPDEFEYPYTPPVLSFSKLWWRSKLCRTTPLFELKVNLANNPKPPPRDTPADPVDVKRPGASVIESSGQTASSLFKSIVEAPEHEAARGHEPDVTPAEPQTKKAEPAIFSRTPVRNIFRASMSAIDTAATTLDTFATKTREMHDQQVIETSFEALIGLFERVFQSACKEVSHARTVRAENGDEDFTFIERRIMLQESAKKFMDILLSVADRETRMKELGAIHAKQWTLGVKERIPELVDARVARHLEVMGKAHFAAFGDDIASSPQRPGLQEALNSEVLAILLEGADPYQFEHPYTPPGAILPKTWWRINLCGVKAQPQSDWERHQLFSLPQEGSES